MKKLLFLTAVFATSYFAGHTQSTRVGFTAGSVFANYHSNADQTANGNSKTGLSAGVLVDIPAGKHFSFQPAVNFVQKGTKDEQTLGGVTEKVKLGVNSIEVPLNFLYNTGDMSGNFFIGAGPSFAFGISGKWKYEDGTNSLSDDVKLGNSDNDDLKRLDIGANFLTGYRFSSGFFIAANYNQGFNNLVPKSTGSEKLTSHYFGIKLGLLLKGAGKK